MLKTLDLLIPIFREVFDDDNLLINLSTTANDIEGWDSLANIRLVVAIEKFFKLRFSASEISNLENVRDVVNLILKKQKNI